MENSLSIVSIVAEGKKVVSRKMQIIGFKMRPRGFHRPTADSLRRSAEDLRRNDTQSDSQSLPHLLTQLPCFPFKGTISYSFSLRDF